MGCPLHKVLKLILVTRVDFFLYQIKKKRTDHKKQLSGFHQPLVSLDNLKRK